MVNNIEADANADEVLDEMDNGFLNGIWPVDTSETLSSWFI